MDVDHLLCIEYYPDLVRFPGMDLIISAKSHSVSIVIMLL